MNNRLLKTGTASDLKPKKSIEELSNNSVQNLTSDQKKLEDIKAEVKKSVSAATIAPKESVQLISSERLQEAIIWSEILGKPLGKRRKRR